MITDDIVKIVIGDNCDSCFRAGFFAEALERCDLEHEIKPKDFPLASNDYELDVSKMIDLMNLRSPKTPFIFARSSEAKRAESCLEWLGFRVNQEFRPKVMELESFIEELITATRNQPPTFAQIRRLLFETKFDFVRGNRCDFHSQTDKVACSIGNVKKYLYFMCEMLYDYYEFDLLEGRHFPLGYEASSCPSRTSVSTPSSIIGDDGLDEISSLASSFSIGSYEHKRNVEHPRKPDNSFSNRKIADDIPSSGSSISARSSKSLPNSSAPNSFSNINSFQYSDSHIRTADTWSIYSEPPRRPNSTDCRKPMSTPINAAYVSGVNSFASGVSPSYNHPQQRAAQYGNSSVKSPQQNSLHNHSQSLYSFSSPTHTSQYSTNSNTPNLYSNPTTSYYNPSSHHNNSLSPHNMSSSSLQTSSSTSYKNNPSNYNNNNSPSNYNNSNNNNKNPSNYNNNSNSPSNYSNNNSNSPSNYDNSNLQSPPPHRDSISTPLTGLSPISSLGRSRGRGLSSSSPLGASSTLPPSIPTTSRGRARGTVPAAPLPRRPNVCPSKAKDRT